MTTPREQITGLVLAGGRGSRMGGVDKGLQLHAGRPLAWHALQRLRPQVGPLMISANRHPDAYAALGVPVWRDTLPEHPGPLAGMLAALAHCATPWMVSVPCDCPRFPSDLVARLAAACAADGSELAVAATLEAGALRTHPVFCLLASHLMASLEASLARGERKVERWIAQHRTSIVTFDDPAAFFNANTPADLQQLARED